MSSSITSRIQDFTTTRDWKVVNANPSGLPQAAQSALFTVSDMVEVKMIVGVVSQNIQNQANNTKLVANPTGFADLDLCTVLDIDNDQAGEFYYTNGAANALGNDATGAGFSKSGEDFYVIAGGTIDLSCAAASTGNISWWCVWRELASGATVTSAV